MEEAGVCEGLEGELAKMRDGQKEGRKQTSNGFSLQQYLSAGLWQY